MPKYSIQAALEEVASERRDERRLEKWSHPLRELQDSKGSLTRYPIQGEDGQPLNFLPADWLWKYIAAGGSCDANGVWGVSPYNKEWANACPRAAALILKVAGRLDFSGSLDLAKDVATGVARIDQGIDHKSLYRLIRGADRRATLIHLGVHVTRSHMALGHMTEMSFNEYAFSRIPRASREAAHDMRITAPEEMLEWIAKNGCTAAARKMAADAILYTRRSDRAWSAEFNSSTNYAQKMNAHKMRERSLSPAQINTLLAYNKHRGSIINIKYKFVHEAHNRHVQHSYTSLGYIYYVGNIVATHNGEIIPTRSIGEGLMVAKVGSIYFVWQTAAGFGSHAEGNTLAAALEVINTRVRRAGNILSLNDVRNDRKGTSGFCFAGTKNFLARRMPFVYRLVSQYATWSDVPADIMATEWHLASREIFSGYPQP